jgi:hypothetical protein
MQKAAEAGFCVTHPKALIDDATLNTDTVTVPFEA